MVPTVVRSTSARLPPTSRWMRIAITVQRRSVESIRAATRFSASSRSAPRPGLGEGAGELARRRLGALAHHRVHRLWQRVPGLQRTRDELQHVRQLLAERGPPPPDPDGQGDVHDQPAEQRPAQDADQEIAGRRASARQRAGPSHRCPGAPTRPAVRRFPPGPAARRVPFRCWWTAITLSPSRSRCDRGRPHCERGRCVPRAVALRCSRPDPGPDRSLPMEPITSKASTNSADEDQRQHHDQRPAHRREPSETKSPAGT